MKTFKLFLEAAPKVDKKSIGEKAWWVSLQKHLKSKKVSSDDELMQSVSVTVDNWDAVEPEILAMTPKAIKALEKQIKSK